jgi:pyruvate/2-oxoglutarate dehydrogenase complex dihydrolipoamide dehydrogenase (E3) component
MVDNADVVVLGMGPGGEEVAGRLAEAGLDVVGIESTLLGGECPYWGCVPSKMMLRAAGLLAEARRVPGMAGWVTVDPDYAPVAARLREATDNWNDQVAVDRFTGKGGRFVRGHARLAGPHEVEIEGGDIVHARRAVVVATGSRPSIPPVDGLAGTPYWTNRDAIEAAEPPASLAVLGGGAIGVELGQAFARFGSQVTVVEAFDRLIAMEEPEASALLADVLPRDGISVRTGVAAQSVQHQDGRFTLSLPGAEPVTAERLLVATGRHADLSDLRVDTIDVDPSERWLPVDDQMRVTDGVWGVGDVTGKGAFTHVATYQADIAVHSILGRPRAGATYHALPRVTFTDPEIGAVGQTEKQARDAGVSVQVGHMDLPRSARGWIHKAGNDGFIKLVADSDRGVLVGATAAGPAGGEILGFLAVAVHAAVPVQTLREMIYAYPTLYRAIEDALRDLGS